MDGGVSTDDLCPKPKRPKEEREELRRKKAMNSPLGERIDRADRVEALAHDDPVSLQRQSPASICTGCRGRRARHAGRDPLSSWQLTPDGECGIR